MIFGFSRLYEVYRGERRRSHSGVFSSLPLDEKRRRDRHTLRGHWRTQGPACLGTCPGSLLGHELVSLLVSWSNDLEIYQLGQIQYVNLFSVARLAQTVEELWVCHCPRSCFFKRYIDGCSLAPSLLAHGGPSRYLYRARVIARNPNT